mgnify:CR=1 FL=1|tara:strand:+ start:1279 stop:1992 length:714 start_codon:yes stop_codon:yes gene_type:complete
MTLKNYLSEREELHKLFSKEMDQPLNERYVCYDGAVHPENYLKSKFKIAWLLKEAYDSPNGIGGGWSWSELLPKDELYNNFKKLSHQTWHPITYVSFAILNNFPVYMDIPYIHQSQNLCESLWEIAVVNTQKLPSKTTTKSHYRIIKKAFETHSHLIKKQLKMLNADILICGSTMSLYKEMFGLSDIDIKSNGSVNYWIKNGKIFIDAYHPAQRTISREIYVNDILSAVKIWSDGLC